MTTSKTLTKADLSQFTGSEQWYRHGLVRDVLFTDGAKYVADADGAYWLLDEIALAQRSSKRVAGEEFQLWKLAVKADKTAPLTCDDGNGNIVFTKAIEFTDFPLEEITLYFTNKVILLPSEILTGGDGPPQRGPLPSLAARPDFQNHDQRRGKSMAENFLEMLCPKCGGEDRIDIHASCWIRVCKDGTDADLSGCGGQDYEPMSPAVCRACDHPGTVWEFEVAGGWAMSYPAFIEIDGRRLLWRDLVKRRREQLQAAANAVQPARFEVRATPARNPSAPPRGAIRSRRCSRFWKGRADRPALPRFA